MHFVGTAVDVRALHVMPDVEGPEGELHTHDYRIEVVVERERLDDRGMVATSTRSMRPSPPPPTSCGTRRRMRPSATES